ncbi:MAG: aminoacyl-tRNA hydrolase, partial [Saprospiraceae bacterium]|nr:aminoacyl-tRNA hydrolase [Saprospiraceae bacterium]
MRLRGKGSGGGHNVLKDINQMIGQKYARLRVGIGNTFGKGKQVDYVLGKWSDEEKEKLPELIKKGGEIALSFAAIGIGHTMTRYNS